MFLKVDFFSTKKNLGKMWHGTIISYTEECVAKDIGETGQNVFHSNKQFLHPILGTQ